MWKINIMPEGISELIIHETVMDKIGDDSKQKTQLGKDTCSKVQSWIKVSIQLSTLTPNLAPWMESDNMWDIPWFLVKGKKMGASQWDPKKPSMLSRKPPTINVISMWLPQLVCKEKQGPAPWSIHRNRSMNQKAMPIQKLPPLLWYHARFFHA